LFGKKAKIIREELNLPPGGLQRNHFGSKSLRLIETVQESATRHMQANPGISPVEAVKYIISVNHMPIRDYSL
jgi:hypothetical protein